MLYPDEARGWRGRRTIRILWRGSKAFSLRIWADDANPSTANGLRGFLGNRKNDWLLGLDDLTNSDHAG